MRAQTPPTRQCPLRTILATRQGHSAKNSAPGASERLSDCGRRTLRSKYVSSRQRCWRRCTGASSPRPAETQRARSSRRTRGEVSDSSASFRILRLTLLIHLIHRLGHEYTYHNCTLREVHIGSCCDVRAVTFKRCNLDNVSFKDGHSENVMFENVTLKNVTFVKVHFKKVRLRGAEIKLVDWKNLGIENARITSDSLPGTAIGQLTLQLSHTGRSSFSKTTIFTAPWSSSGIRSLGTGDVKITNPQTGLLDMPKSILDRILGYLFPRAQRDTGSTIVIDDYVYTTKPSTLVCPNENGVGLTYRGASTECTDASRSSRQPLNFRMPFLLVSKRCHQLAIRYVYDRPFSFRSAESCLAFLHDHQRSEHNLAGYALRY